ncbi:MAG: hypothetical protein LBH75_04135 [Treponema sp.]|jgi:hypothetical protein|nr:hypothetical protein [Treponema sp.]
MSLHLSSLDTFIIIRVICSFFLFLYPLYAEEAYEGAYMVPQTVYVGDRATLIVPLGASHAAAAVEPMNIDPPPPQTELVVHKIAVERQKDGMHLIVEFTAFETGILELLPITVPGFADEFRLSVAIASLISPSTMSLSPPAPPLAVSGTAALLYGTSISLILAIFILVSARVFWVRQFLSLSVLFKNHLLIFSMKRRLDSLQKSPQKNKILDSLSAEFRLFLSRFFNTDCSALTADEFSSFPFLERTADHPQDSALRTIFRRLDSFRFNFNAESEDNVRAAIEDVSVFIEKLRSEMRRKP